MQMSSDKDKKGFSLQPFQIRVLYLRTNKQFVRVLTRLQAPYATCCCTLTVPPVREKTPKSVCIRTLDFWNVKCDAHLCTYAENEIICAYKNGDLKAS